MKYAVLSLSLAAALAGATTMAFADEQTSAKPVPMQVAASPDQNLAKQQAMTNDAVKAYNSGVNPLATYHSSGVYDQEDAVKGANGFPLPGMYMYNGDSNGGGSGS